MRRTRTPSLTAGQCRRPRPFIHSDIRSVADAPLVLWRALVALYDDTFVYVRANLAWASLGAPVFLLVFLAVLPYADSIDQRGTGETWFAWPLIVAATGIVLIPSPATAGLAYMAAVSAAGETPGWHSFVRGVVAHWRLAAGLCFVSVAGAFVLTINVVFYFAAEGWVKLVGVLWGYTLLFWLALQIYVAPLLAHVTRPRLLDLYRRAALLTIAHPVFTLLLALLTMTVGFLGALFLPVGLLLGGAYVALLQAHALRALRIRLGDLTVERTDTELEDFPSR